MQPKREPKVHTYSRKRRRPVSSPAHTVLSICLTFAVAGLIGVVGYSIAKPILQLTGKEDTSVSTAQSTPPAVTTLTEAALTETVQTSASSTETVSAPQRLAVCLPESAMESTQALADAVKAAKDSCPEMCCAVVPMKLSGGVLLYDSGISLAKNCGASQGVMTPAEIVRTTEENGCTVIASCSLLKDNLVPDGDAQAGYLTIDGSRWLDNKKENGGKPWLSPFSESGRQYLADLVGEMADAGFEEIWCSDVVFPAFRNTDIAYLGEAVQAPDRGETLAALLNQLAQTAGSVPVRLETDAQEILSGTEEAFLPEQLMIDGTAVRCVDMTQAEAICRLTATDAPHLQAVLMLPSDAVQQTQRENLTEQYTDQLWGFAVIQ